ncbi:MAG: TraR/DksA family transcriptional regulator [Burkholderiales bacterium]|uniref:TraR/DksA family transcriptional regulator n=1 Tax=Inhella sp. TaxID=1921806 RepID=UPI001AD0DEB1|nr:TraR/DksA family transcriptional regulator [Burkholderiales bacterium]
MSDTALTAGQRAQIEALLLQQQDAVERAMRAQQGGAGRVEFASQLLSDDPDAPREHEGERELQLERADHLADAQRQIGDALLRLRADDYGACSDCGATIPFDRLRAQPVATRCVNCQQRAEAA